jgi:hypothetical protein
LFILTNLFFDKNTFQKICKIYAFWQFFKNKKNSRFSPPRAVFLGQILEKPCDRDPGLQANLAAGSFGAQKQELAFSNSKLPVFAAILIRARRDTEDRSIQKIKNREFLKSCISAKNQL